MASTLDQCDQIWRNFAKTLKVFGYFLWVYFVFCKFLILIRHIFRILDKFSLLLMPQYWKDNLANWSHFSRDEVVLEQFFLNISLLDSGRLCWQPASIMPQWSPIPQTHQVNLGQPRASSAVKSTKVYSVFHFFFFRIRSPHFPGFETMETHFSAENLFIFFSFVDWWSENLKLFREFVLFSSVKCKHLHLFLNFLYFQYHEESVDVVLGFEKEFVKASASLTRPDGVPTPLAISLSMSLRNANECNMQQQQIDQISSDNLIRSLMHFTKLERIWFITKLLLRHLSHYNISFETSF